MEVIQGFGSGYVGIKAIEALSLSEVPKMRNIRLSYDSERVLKGPFAVTNSLLKAASLEED